MSGTYKDSAKKERKYSEKSKMRSNDFDYDGLSPKQVKRFNSRARR